MEYTIAFNIEININNFISKKICRLYIYTFSHVLMHIYSNSNKGNEISRFFDKKIFIMIVTQYIMPKSIKRGWEVQ